MLKQDHNTVKDLFDQFENTDDRQTQMELARQALQELKIHSAIEEEIFYPAARKVIDDQEIMHEALEEHHVAHLLIDELDEADLDPETFHAKFKVLAESVRHHIKEEEGKMLPKIDPDETNMEQLAARMALRKEELIENPDELRTPQAKSRSTRRSTKTSPRGPRGGGRGRHRQPSPR
jgi:Hemerythrin HHE cation binding domain